MKRTRKLLAAALAAVLALTILSGCSQTENIYNTIVTPAAEPDPMTAYYARVINEKLNREGENSTDKYSVAVLASAELDQKAKEAAALIENGMSKQEAACEVMKNFASGEEKVFYGEEEIDSWKPVDHIWQIFKWCQSIDPKETWSTVGSLEFINYPAFKIGTATYIDGGKSGHSLIIVVAYNRFLYDRRT